MIWLIFGQIPFFNIVSHTKSFLGTYRTGGMNDHPPQIICVAVIHLQESVWLRKDEKWRQSGGLR